MSLLEDREVDVVSDRRSRASVVGSAASRGSGSRVLRGRQTHLLLKARRARADGIVAPGRARGKVAREPVLDLGRHFECFGSL